MKIITLSELHQLKPGTLFQKYTPMCFDSMEVFEESWGTDFLTSPIGDPDFEGSTSSRDSEDLCEKMEAGASVPLVYGESCGRDGLYDKGQLFAIHEKQDVERLIAYLQIQLERGYQ